MQFEPWPAALAAFLVVVQVVLVMVPGFYYTKKGTVDTSTRRKLSIISFNLLLPATNFYHIARNVSASTITEYLPFAANTVLSNVLGMCMGWLGNWAVGTPKVMRNHVVAAAGFGNLNSLPLLIATAMCQHDSLPFLPALGAQCSSVGFGYIAVGTAATQMFTYPIAIWLLKKRPEPALVEVVVAHEPLTMDDSCEVHSNPLLAVGSTQTAGMLRASPFSKAAAEEGGEDSLVVAAELPAAAALAAQPAAAAAAQQDASPPAAATAAAPSEAATDAAVAVTSFDPAKPKHLAASGSAGHAGEVLSFAVEFTESDSDSASVSGASTASSHTQLAAGNGSGPASVVGSPLLRTASSGSLFGSRASGEGYAGTSASREAAGGTSFPQVNSQGKDLAAQDAQQPPPPAVEAPARPSVEVPLPSARPGTRLRRRAQALARRIHTLRSAMSAAPVVEGPPPSRARRWASLTWKFTNENVLRMPCIGAGLGLVVGVIAPIKNLLFPVDTAALGFLMGALFSIQAALIWCSSFVLGSALSKGPGPGMRAMGWKPMFLVVLVRLLVLPALGCVIVVGVIKLGWYDPPDPVYTYILLQQFCVPSANQMQNIASMAGNREREMGSLIFWQYVVAFFAIPAWMVVFLWLMDTFTLFPGA